MTTATGRIQAAGAPDLLVSAGYTVLTTGGVPPTIPDGIWPMGVDSPNSPHTAASLTDYIGDWNFGTMGLDLSGYRIHGRVVCNVNGIHGDGFEVIGQASGPTVPALIDCNHHFTGAIPNLKHFTVKPQTPNCTTNALMGDEFNIYDFDFSETCDGLSPNNLSNGKLPLNIIADWGYIHDLVYYYPDTCDAGHTDGTHNDNCQIPGGTGAKFTRIYMTGLSHPTLGQGAFLRTTGPSTGPVPGKRPKGQLNSSIQFTQNVSHVGDITYDMCRFGGGEIATINCSAGTSLTPGKLGPITVTNSIFNGDALLGYDIIYNPTKGPGTTLIQSGNKRADGSAIVVNSKG